MLQRIGNHKMVDIAIPDVTLNISREHLPQIKGDFLPLFLDHLKCSGIQYNKKMMNPKTLKATQGEFNIGKIRKLIKSSNDTHSIIVSNDDYILDGHHRWLADLNTSEKTKTIVVDLPILDLIAAAKEFEGVTYKDITEQRVKTLKNVIRESLSERKII